MGVAEAVAVAVAVAVGLGEGVAVWVSAGVALGAKATAGEGAAGVRLQPITMAKAHSANAKPKPFQRLARRLVLNDDAHIARLGEIARHIDHGQAEPVDAVRHGGRVKGIQHPLIDRVGMRLADAVPG